MATEPYLTQILIAVAKGCKPNSPIEDRVWFSMRPPSGLTIARLRPAIDALVKAGLLVRDRKAIWRVKPTRVGYVLVEDWKRDRLAMRARPVLFSPIIKEQEPVTVLDQRYDRWAGYNHNSHQAA